jgi:lysophospholipase L1-like esterase
MKKLVLSAAIVLILMAGSAYVGLRFGLHSLGKIISLIRATTLAGFDPSDHADVVFIGDSIVQGGHWGEYFPGVVVANRGVFGDRTQDIQLRMDTILSTHARRGFVMAGINDVLSGVPASDTLRNEEAIADTLRQHGTTPVILSTLYVSALHRDHAHINQNVKSLNDGLRQWAQGQGIAFIDLNSQMMDGDSLASDLTMSDGVHINARGYAAIRRQIAAQIQ